MKILNLIITIVLFTSINIELYSQQNEINPTNTYTISEGLSHNGITSVLEDSHGYIWIGTNDGLNKYDGYEFEVYKNTIEKDVLINNCIRALYEDKNGNIWIGTETGISIYDYNQQRFTNFSDSSLNEVGFINKIIQFGNDVICITSSSLILVFDEKYKVKQVIEYPQAGVKFYDLKVIDNQYLLLASSNGLISYNFSTNKFTTHISRTAKFAGFVAEIKSDLFLTSLDKGIGILKISPNTNQLNLELKQVKFEDYRIETAFVATNNQIWFGALDKALLRVENIDDFINNDDFEFVQHRVNSGISCIYSSQYSGCWVGTRYQNGLLRFENKQNPFYYFNKELNLKYGLKSDNIMSTAVLDSNRVFISMLNKGLVLLNTKTGLYEPLPFKLHGLDENKIKSVFVDESQNIWIQIGFQGLFIWRSDEKKLEKVLSNGKYPFLDVIIRSYTQDKNGHLWIANKEGVFKIKVYRNGGLQSVESLQDNPLFYARKLVNARFVYADPLYDFIWVTTDNDGLFRIELRGGRTVEQLKVSHYVANKNNPKAISSNAVTSVLRIPDNSLWLTTERGGICKVENSAEEAEFIPYAEKAGLSNHVVTSIQNDSENNLWVSTNNGLNKFDPKSGKFRSFNKDDGLPFEAFKYGSARLNNNKLVFFGYDGFCYFSPALVTITEHLPKLEFGNLKIRNNRILPGDTIENRVILKGRLQNKESFVLKYDENVISFELKSLHYSNPQSHRLQYQLLPINKSWTEVTSDQRFVNYNELRPGKYTFRVKASNSLNEWTQPKELYFKIKPPIYKTIWAYMTYIFMIVGALYVYMKFRFSVQKLKHSLEIEQLKIDKVQEVNAAKLRYFSNISHEIKTPLTLINGPVENLINRFMGNADVREKLNIIQRQSKKITLLVDQVHDFQKSDANQLKLNKTDFSFDVFIKELIEEYTYLAKSSQKQLTINAFKTNVYVSADKDKLEKIINNLISNAFKYTEKGDVIELSYKKKGRELQIEVNDTGRGIDKDDLPYIFERFYQSRKEHSPYIGGSGIGLAFSKRLVEMHMGHISAESELGKGTCLKVNMPVVISSLSNQQIEKEKEAISGRNVDVFDAYYDKTKVRISEEFRESTVFLVEDNTDLRLFVQETLSDLFKVRSFENGKEFMKAFEEEWPDIIVSDVLMPEMNGFELCRKVKSDIKTSHIPVVLLTACTTVDEEIQGLKEGADAYIKKPFNMQHLITRIESLLQNRKQLRERFQMNFPLSLEKTKEDNSDDQIFLEKLYQVMSDNLDNQDLDAELMARAMYLNRTHLFQKVKAITNQTPFDLLKAYRITKAAYMIVNNRVSVNEAMVMTGFKSRTTFTNLFKDKYGVTPGKYAEESMKENK